MVQSEEELRKLARQQKEQNNCDKAVILYEKIYSPGCDCWVAWEYAYCLKKLGRLDDAILVSKNTYQRDKQFFHNNNFLSWLLYEKYFKHPKEEYNDQEINHMYEIALSITTFTMQNDKSAYERTIVQMLKLLKSHANNPTYRMLVLLEKLDVQKLSSKAGKYEESGREKEYESQREMFYSMKTKALLDSESYSECISCCDEALLCIEQFHHDNKSWISARKAVSMAHVGNYDGGIAELKKTIVNKKHWSLFEKIADIYLIKKDSQNALLYFSMAAITNDPPKMKVTLYVKMAVLLYSMNENTNAWMHLCFAKEIREKEKWSITCAMLELYTKLSVYKLTEMVQLYQLKEYWLQVIYKGLGKHDGVISRINTGGKTGFISSDSGSYFFRRLSFVEKTNFKEHDKVTFCLVESFDAKRQRPSSECGYIKIYS